MRKLTLYIIFATLALLAQTVIAEAVLEYFKAESRNGGDVVLEWKSSTESGVSEYVIQRSPTGYGNDYYEIDRVPARGNHSVYTYKDETAYKSSEVSYYYRLGYDNDMHFSQAIKVTTNVGIGKKTWGSIKAMFR
jgi:hypothetical protein